MKILQTKGTIKNGELIIKVPQNFSQKQVDVVILVQDEADEIETLRQQARDNGYDSKEKILDLIHQVKQEMLAEKGLLDS